MTSELDLAIEKLEGLEFDLKAAGHHTDGERAREAACLIKEYRSKEKGINL